jgi:6-phosphogluconolactonase (cycloisomerase 2 family)
MAQQTRFSSPSRAASFPHALRNPPWKTARLITALAAILLGSSPTHAQSPQQQYVYASVPVTTTTSEVAGFSKDSSGNLTAVAGSPWPDTQEGGLVAVDALGRFLFVINAHSDDISMFWINQDGSLTEVSGSPFAAAPTVNPTMTPGLPLCLTTENSGQFLYVGYRNGNYPQQGAIIEYLIDFQGSPLAPASISIVSTDVAAVPIGIVTSPQGYLYAALNLVPDSTEPNQLQGTYVYSINSQSGQLTLIPNGGSANPNEQTIAIDRQGRFLFDGWGNSAATGSIEGAPILSDGTAVPSAPPVSVSSSGSFPSAMLVESSGQFLYVQEGSNVGKVSGYSIDQTTGALSPIQIPPTSLSFQNGSAAADPMGPYVYSLQTGYVHAFSVDLSSGGLSELQNSPYLVASGGGLSGLAISGTPVQAATGLAAALAPLSEDFGDVVPGQSSSTQIIKLTNTGGEVLSVSLVSVTGANPSDFIATPNCPLPLQPRISCAIGVVFQPTSIGARQAILTVTDPAGSQTAQLTGTGVAAQPAVTLMPGSLTFPSAAQGSTSSAQTVTITNSGAAPLHISSILPSGADFSDFNIIVANTCSAALIANASCTLSVTFSPLGDGSRTASITINDDAPGSPQSVQLTGTGSGPSVARSAVTLSPALLSFGTVTQGASSAPQNVTLTSTGTAALHISSVALTGANPTDFSLTNGCTAPAYAVNATCTIGLTFTPLATGLLTATLTITDDAPNSPQTISISGNASLNSNPSPALTVTGGLSATVTAGQTATYNLQLVADFSGSISFTCTGAPATATCTSAPSPLKVTSGTSVPFTVSVATTATGATAQRWSPPRPPPFASLRLLQTLTLCAILAAILLLCFAGRTPWPCRGAACCAPSRQDVNCRGMQRQIPRGAIAALAIAALLSAAGCGGGTIAESAQVPVTPAQTTSTITLQPSATNASGTPVGNLQPIQLTLIVN